MNSMQKILAFVSSHLGGALFIALGIWGVLYSCLAKRISFQGDFPLTREERKTYRATRRVRKRALLISLLPLGYGIILLFYP
jgi:hypothetical protein